MALHYLDSSALVKLVVDEPESTALRAYVDGADLITSELALTEVPRSVRRVAATVGQMSAALHEKAAELFEYVALLPVDRVQLETAGALEEPALRALDAIHIVAASDVGVLDAFVSYDMRQNAAARLAGLRTVSPGTQA